MEPVKTVELWLQIEGGSYWNASDYFLACGEIETIFNNYDSSLKIIETTATISDTLLLSGSPIFTIATLQGRPIQLRYGGKVLFAAYIKDAKCNPKANEINLDIASILDKLNVTISEAFLLAKIVPLLANFPAGQRFLEQTTYQYWDWIGNFGWDEYEKWRGEGTLQDNLPPAKSTTYASLVCMDKLVQALVKQLTGYDCYLTNPPTPYTATPGSTGIESGIIYSDILDFNSEIVCQNESERVRNEDATYFELISVLNRRGYTLMWNPVAGRFEYKKITFLGSMVNDYRRYQMPESKDILEVTTENRNMRRALKSKCEYCDWNGAKGTNYMPAVDSTGSAVPPPTKITNFSSLNEFVLPDGGYSSIPVIGEVSLSDSTNMLIFRIFGDDQWREAFSLIILCDARFTRYYKINTVLTYLLLDSSDTDNQAFYNLTANKIKFIGGVPFSELEILQEIPF